MIKGVILSLLLLLTALTLSAKSSVVKRSTDVLCLLPSGTGFVKALVEQDREGLWQLGLSSATTLAANYALEAAIKKDRPDGTGHHAFPSTHAAVAFDGATFLMRRYGWKWGVPAYAVSAYVAWGRVYADRHDWWDVLGGAVLGTASALIYTRPISRKADLTIAPVAFGRDACGVGMYLRF